MRVIIIGGTGHVGTYLVPGLLLAGHEVISVSRLKREPYNDHPAWKSVRQVQIDRTEAEKNCSIDQAKRVLKYSPRYSSLQAVRESVKHMMENDLFRK